VEDEVIGVAEPGGERLHVTRRRPENVGFVVAGPVKGRVAHVGDEQAAESGCSDMVPNSEGSVLGAPAPVFPPWAI
jgi:hypothetical protein